MLRRPPGGMLDTLIPAIPVVRLGGTEGTQKANPESVCAAIYTR